MRAAHGGAPARALNNLVDLLTDHAPAFPGASAALEPAQLRRPCQDPQKAW